VLWQNIILLWKNLIIDCKQNGFVALAGAQTVAAIKETFISLMSYVIICKLNTEKNIPLNFPVAFIIF
jgi:hypothetical protein